jgi:hypothetical protein
MGSKEVILMALKKHSEKSPMPQVLPDVATDPHPGSSTEPVQALPDNYAVSPKDRLETRPEGKLPTPLDPASAKARGWPADPKPDVEPEDIEATT